MPGPVRTRDHRSRFVDLLQPAPSSPPPPALAGHVQEGAWPVRPFCGRLSVRHALPVQDGDHCSRRPGLPAGAGVGVGDWGPGLPAGAGGGGGRSRGDRGPGLPAGPGGRGGRSRGDRGPGLPAGAGGGGGRSRGGRGPGLPAGAGVGVVAAGGPGARCIAGARCRTCPAQAGCECMNHFHICNDLPLPSALLTTHH